jgi:two-component system NarL family response regulator
MTRPRVVLAEDNAPMAQQLLALLEPSCEVVKSVGDGAALIDAVSALQPDVIVSDIAMPGVSGLAAARRILAAQPAARIVVVTIRDEPSVVRAALQYGVLAYVLKDDAGDELVSAVRAVIAGEEYVSTNARAALKKASACDELENGWTEARRGRFGTDGA